MAPSETRTRLLDAAERHFADKGFEGASLREITRDARANLAAVHYHFGSKADLFVAVLARRIEPINRERMELLDAAAQRVRGRPLAVETLLEVLIAPVLRRGLADRRHGPCFLRLFGRAQSESEELWKRIMEGPLREIRQRIFAGLRRALPDLPEPELALRMHFAIGVMKSVASDQHRLEALSGGSFGAEDIEEVIRGLVAFLAAGFRARPTLSAPPRAARKQRSRS